jgi:hypothetical protein
MLNISPAFLPNFNTIGYSLWHRTFEANTELEWPCRANQTVHRLASKSLVRASLDLMLPSAHDALLQVLIMQLCRIIKGAFSSSSFSSPPSLPSACTTAARAGAEGAGTFAGARPKGGGIW